MKAILTKYLPCTCTKPSRIKASAEGVPSKIYSCEKLDNERGAVERHVFAARLFAEENQWSGGLSSGGLPGQDAWAHCFNE